MAKGFERDRRRPHVTRQLALFAFVAAILAVLVTLAILELAQHTT